MKQGFLFAVRLILVSLFMFSVTLFGLPQSRAMLGIQSLKGMENEEQVEVEEALRFSDEQKALGDAERLNGDDAIVAKNRSAAAKRYTAAIKHSSAAIKHYATAFEHYREAEKHLYLSTLQGDKAAFTSRLRAIREPWSECAEFVDESTAQLLKQWIQSLDGSVRLSATAGGGHELTHLERRIADFNKIKILYKTGFQATREGFRTYLLSQSHRVQMKDRRCSKYDEAIKSFDKAILEIRRWKKNSTPSDEKLLARVKNLESHTYFELGHAYLTIAYEDDGDPDLCRMAREALRRSQDQSFGFDRKNWEITDIAAVSYQLGMAHQSLGDFSEAVRCYTDALQTKALDAETRKNAEEYLSQSVEALRRYAETQGRVHRRKRLNPRARQTVYGRAQGSARRGG